MNSTRIKLQARRARERAALQSLQHQVDDVRVIAEACRRIAAGAPPE